MCYSFTNSLSHAPIRMAFFLKNVTFFINLRIINKVIFKHGHRLGTNLNGFLLEFYKGN